MGDAGCLEWRKIGLAPPAGVRQSTQKYRDDNNSVGQWIETACFLEPKLRTSMKDLYDPYASWCESSSLEPLHGTLFGKELTRLGYKIFKAKRGNGRMGIGLKQPSGTAGALTSRLSMPFPAQVSNPCTAKQSLN
jgi:phage/plasmid-associated DNA primase